MLDVGGFSHSLRAICTVLLDPRDPLLQSERMQGFAVDPVYAKGEVFAYVGLPQNLKDLGGDSCCDGDHPDAQPDPFRSSRF